jgi:uncharacterized hydrophobic protein (TIGR00271 family)
MPEADGKPSDSSDDAFRTRWLDIGDPEKTFEKLAGGVADSGSAYWIVLVLAGAIATLGLALDSPAVIIGAMLIAPLLGPVVGLALAISVGDARLAAQALLLVVGSTVAVIAVAALLTVLLPFHDVTAEILARTRPTILDLVIAGCSGIAGAVVSVTRGERLAGALPGVAVAVALVPPLAVTGFGIGAGWNSQIIGGSLILYAANLAGIVASGSLVFLAVGMNYPHMRELARKRHARNNVTGFAAAVDRLPGVRRLGMVTSLWSRIALMAGFTAVVAIPLSASLRRIVRETRVQRAVENASSIFRVPNRSVIVSENIEIAPDETHVILGVATSRWYGDEARNQFMVTASREAGERITLVLQQLPASTGDLSSFASVFNTRVKDRVVAPVTKAPPASAELRFKTASVIESLSLPGRARIIEYSIVVSDSGPPEIDIAYAADDSVTSADLDLLSKQLATNLNEPRINLATRFISTRPVRVRSLSRDGEAVRSLVSLLNRYRDLSVVVATDSGVPSRIVKPVLAMLDTTANRRRIRIEQRSAGQSLSLQLVVQPSP